MKRDKYASRSRWIKRTGFILATAAMAISPVKMSGNPAPDMVVYAKSNDSLNNSNTKLEIENSVLKSENKELKNTNTQLEMEKSDLESENEKLKNEIASLKQKNSELETKIANTPATVEKIQYVQVPTPQTETPAEEKPAEAAESADEEKEDSTEPIKEEKPENEVEAPKDAGNISFLFQANESDAETVEENEVSSVEASADMEDNAKTEANPEIGVKQDNESLKKEKQGFNAFPLYAGCGTIITAIFAGPPVLRKLKGKKESDPDNDDEI